MPSLEGQLRGTYSSFVGEYTTVKNHLVKKEKKKGICSMKSRVGQWTYLGVLSIV